jgi:hypothetical protein
MRSLNRVLLAIVVLLAAAGLAAFLRARGDRHRLGGAVDLAGTLDPLVAEFNRLAAHPRLLMVLAPACPVCLEGALAVHQQILADHDDLRVLAVWMEALPFDITRNPARRVETFAGEPRMVHFYDTQQVSGEALRGVLQWPENSTPWSVFLVYPPGATWDESPPVPAAWFHQREVAEPVNLRTGPDLTRALHDALTR